MTIIWFLLQIICWFCYYDRVSVKRSHSSLTNGQKNKHETKSKHRFKHDEQQQTQQQSVSLKIYREQYIRTEMLVLFLATFITYFNQTALETIVSAFTEKHFRWTSVHISILFAFAGLEIIIVYVLLVKIFSKRFQDRILLIFGFIALILACTLGTFFTWASHSFGWSANSNSTLVDKRLLTMFIMFVILDLLGLPFIAATSVSLFTKLTNKELQGFSQGIQRFMMGIGTIGKDISEISTKLAHIRKKANASFTYIKYDKFNVH
jgi:Na+/melibiose symporter-like transporter